MLSKARAVMRPRIITNGRLMSSEDEDVFQSRTGGVRVQTPDRPPLRLPPPEPEYEYIVSPERQPLGPPDSLLLQQYEGFARFLKSHASPTNKRVTAGGRIVPMGPKSPPPTFHLDFLDKVIEEADEVKKLDNAANPDLRTRRQKDASRAQYKMQEPVQYASQMGLDGTYSGAGPHNPDSTGTSVMGASESLSAAGLMNLPKGFKIVHQIDVHNAIVTSGDQTFLATSTNGCLSLQGLMHFDAQRPQTSHESHVQGAAQRNETSQSQSTSHGKAASYQSEMNLPSAPQAYYHSEPSMRLKQEHLSHQASMQPLNQMVPKSFVPYLQHGVAMTNQSNMHMDQSTPEYKAAMAAMEHSSGFDSLQRRQHELMPIHPAPLLLPAEHMDYPSQLQMIKVQHAKLKVELAKLERYQALNDTTLAPSALERTMERKRRMIVEIDNFRRAKETLEAMIQQPGNLHLVRRTPWTEPVAYEPTQQTSGQSQYMDSGTGNFLAHATNVFKPSVQAHGYGPMSSLARRGLLSPSAAAFVPSAFPALTIGNGPDASTQYPYGFTPMYPSHSTSHYSPGAITFGYNPLDKDMQGAVGFSYDTFNEAQYPANSVTEHVRPTMSKAPNASVTIKPSVAPAMDHETQQGILQEHKTMTSKGKTYPTAGSKPGEAKVMEARNAVVLKDENSVGVHAGGKSKAILDDGKVSQGLPPKPRTASNGSQDVRLEGKHLAFSESDGTFTGRIVSENAEVNQLATPDKASKPKYPFIGAWAAQAGQAAEAEAFKSRSSLAPASQHASGVFPPHPGPHNQGSIAPAASRLPQMPFHGAGTHMPPPYGWPTPGVPNSFAIRGHPTSGWQCPVVVRPHHLIPPVPNDYTRAIMSASAAQAAVRKELHRMQGYGP